jgi:hypothetical protein
MRVLRIATLAALCVLALPFASAQAGVFIGVGIPGPYHRHYYRPYYYGPRVYVAPPPVVVAPAPGPVYVQPAPVYVQPAPVYVQPPPVVLQTPPPPPAPAP